MKVELLFGGGYLEIEVPDRAMVLEASPPPAPDDPLDEVQRALAAPLGAPSLRELARGKKDACLVVSDRTRPVPHGALLPPILEELAAAGLTPDKVTILVATGMHDPPGAGDIRALVGEDIASRYPVRSHDHRDPGACREVVRLEGHPIEINRFYLDSDLKILTGLIEPHPFAGFSGGRKSVLPGLASLKSLQHMHSYRMVAHPAVENLRLDGNPFHHQALQAARAAGADFIVNAVIDRDKRLAGVVAGELDMAHREGCRLAARHVEAALPRRAGLVIASGGGEPLDATFYQAGKALPAAAAIMSPGGTLLLAARCRLGLGEGNFRKLVDACALPEDFHSRYADPANFHPDQWGLQCNLKARAVMGRALIHSPGLKGVNLDLFGMERVEELQEAVDRLAESHQEIAVLPQGPYVIGKVGETGWRAFRTPDRGALRPR